MIEWACYGAFGLIVAAFIVFGVKKDKDAIEADKSEIHYTSTCGWTRIPGQTNEDEMERSRR